MASKWISGSAAQSASWRAALRVAIGAPIRGVTQAGPQLAHPTIPGIGWTLEAVEPPVDGPGSTGAIEVPAEYEKHLGKTHGGTALPPQASAVAISGLPPGLRTAAYARKNLDANGDPLPFPGATAPGPDKPATQRVILDKK